MNMPAFSRNCMPLMLSAALASMAGVALAAPVISRLTPPSNPLVADANTLARFLPGQLFDLQATVRPDTGQTITSVEFKVDGASVGIVKAGASCSDKSINGKMSMMPATAITATAPCAVAASLRGYAKMAVGLHTLTAKATQNDGSLVSLDGNFEVVGITVNNGRPAKNIIIMLGDGMGAAHRTAARIMSKGYLQGKAQGRLAMDTFPVTGMVMTSSLDGMITDSAPGMANYVSGNKAANNQEGVFPDDTTDAFDNPRIEYLAEYLHRTKGTSLGIVTTADVFDATPAANAVHTSNRGNGTGIVDQFLDDRSLTGLAVLMGGGRKWFIPKNSSADPANPANTGNGSVRSSANDYTLAADIVTGWHAAAGSLDANRDLVADFAAAGFAYAPNKAGLDSVGVPDKLLGLFAYSNMNVALDKINGRRNATSVVSDYGFPDQPMLDEMTEKALQVLSKNPKGFILMAEGASIDKQAHLMDSDRWILETIEFDRAIQKAKDFAAANPDTVVIVTADHECSGAAIIGAYKEGAVASKASVLTYQDSKFPKYAMNADGYPVSTDVAGRMLIGYGGNADRYETWHSSETPTQDSQQPFAAQSPLTGYPLNPNVRNAATGFLITGQVSGEQAVHTATDIPLSAYGRGASLFTGVFDNTDVFFKLAQIAVGGSK